MSFGAGHTGGRTRMGTKVFLNVYDLTPANDYLYPIGFGLHHSGVEILGSEYSFASGGGIFDSTPKQAAGARFRATIEMGAYDGGQAELQRAISELRDSFGPDDYNLIRKNCNHFANALCWKLLRRTLPGHVNRLADFGVCCSCLLPRKLIEEAPVGDPNRPSSSSSGFSVTAGRRSAASSSKVTAFSGSGATLGDSSTSGSTASSGMGGGLLGAVRGRSTPSNSSRNDDLTDRREKTRAAALARLERAKAQEANNDSSDRSR